MKKKQVLEKIRQFRRHHFLEIENMVESGSITVFEEKAFQAFCVNAEVSAKIHLETLLPEYQDIKSIDDVGTVVKAYIYLCAVELHAFIILFDKGDNEIINALDVSLDEFIEHFLEIFVEETAKDCLRSCLGLFHNTLYEPKEVFSEVELFGKSNPSVMKIINLWFTQSLMLGNILSEDKINFLDWMDGMHTPEKLSFYISLSDFGIRKADLFQKHVFNK